MRKNIAKPLLASLLAAMSLMLAGCASHTREYTVIDGKKIEFASEYETEKWRAPLEKLLSNTVGMEFYDDMKGEYVREEAPHPERPSIEKGYGCALYDINFDGTPELLVNMGGGSAGNNTYVIYDINTGESLGAIDSSPGNSICCYYAMEEGDLAIVNKYSWRNGWSEKTLFTSIILPGGDGGFEEKMYLESSYEIAMRDVQSGDLKRICTSMYCEVWGEEAEPEEFLFECECFDENYIRIAETEIQCVSWYNIEEEGDTPYELGRKMAEELLSLSQKFIIYEAK